MRVEIVTIGNEVLSGHVQDTNSRFLCRQLTGLGGEVQRVTVLPDAHDVIRASVQQAIERRAQLIVTVGGLGPTEDDRTLAAVADALGCRLVRHPEAMQMVHGKYRELAATGFVDSAAMTPSREKMALLPEGAEALANPAGAAPGVLVRLRDASVVCLPGVPAELRGIFAGSLAPFLRELFGDSAYAERTVVTDCGDESRLAPILRQVGAGCPHVYIKSRAKRFGPAVRIRVVVSTRGADRESVLAALRGAEERLVAALTDAGIERLQE